ncbi:MAG TPA: histone deacetylase [Planctomycetaceae bacterium]
MPVANPPLLFADGVFLEHQTGNHPESSERLRFLHEFLKNRPVSGAFGRGQFQAAQPAQLELIHDAAYIDRVRRFAAGGGGRIESDTIVSPRSFEVACHAVGAALSAVDAVLTGLAPRAICLIRPPGHHALPHSAMGFCLFNNVALAAAYAIQKYGLNRVLIVDWDVHHGNGTQDAFYNSEAVYFMSVHRYPFYPGTGAAHETGSGAGLATKFNLPVRLGTPRPTYLEMFQSTLERAAARARPDLVLISAGFDAHAADPIGSLGLETEDFEPLTRLLRQVADQYCQGRLVSLLEGGYNVHALAESVTCHMEALCNKIDPASGVA